MRMPAGFPKDSLWYNRDIIERVQVEWGRHSLVTATRNMMKLALQEPLNKKLILLSEAGIPLYPPTALYHQLMSEEKSRINSCTMPGVSHLHVSCLLAKLQDVSPQEFSPYLAISNQKSSFLEFCLHMTEHLAMQEGFCFGSSIVHASIALQRKLEPASQASEL